MRFDPEQRISYRIPILDGGLNVTDTPSEMDSQYSPDSINVIYTDDNASATRKGFTKFYTGILNTNYSINGALNYVQSGNEILHVFSSGGLYNFNDGWNSLQTGIVSTTINNVYMLQFQNKVLASDGINRPVKYDPSSGTTYWSIEVQSGIPDMTIGSAGQPSGTYYYKICPRNSSLDIFTSTYSTSGFIADNEQIELTNMPIYSGLEDVSTKYVCRNATETSGVFYLVAEIPNAATSYTDNIGDSGLITRMPTDNFGCPSGNIFVEHEGYIFINDANNPDYLWYSNINDPEVFSSFDFFRIGEGIGLEIKSLDVFDNNIIIFTADKYGIGKIYLLDLPTNDDSTWSLIQLNNTESTSAKLGKVKFDKYIAWLNKNQISDMYIGAKGEFFNSPLSYNITKEIKLIPDEYLENVCAVNYDNKVWFCVPGSGQTSNNTVFQYDYQRGKNNRNRNYGSWSKFDNHNFKQLLIHSGNLLGVHKTNGYVYTLDTGTNDDGSIINAYQTTPYIFGSKNHENHEKFWRYIYINAYNKCNGYVNIYYRDIESDTWSSTTITTTNSEKMEIFKVPINLHSKGIQIKFDVNQLDKLFKINEFEIIYNLRSIR